MKYLFDTDTVSNLLRRAPPTTLLRRLALTPVEDQATSSITLGELYYGARRRADDGVELLSRVDAILIDATIVPFDAEAARAYGELRTQLERAGTPIGDADTRIAAIARVHGLTVVTGNVRHFERVADLAIENWLV